MTPQARLAARAVELPPPITFPSQNRRGCIQHGQLVLVSGHGLQLPSLPGVRQHGRLGHDMTVDEGYATARAVALTILATLNEHCGSLERVTRVLRLFGMVCCTPEFDQQPQVIDGASDLFVDTWGPEAGRHARTAVGMSALPRGIAVEINGEFEVK